jgi:uncharacterized membrane protein
MRLRHNDYRMRVLIGLIIGAILLAGNAHALPDYTFDRVDVYVDLEEGFEEYYITLTCLEEGMEYLDFSPAGPIKASTTGGMLLETETLADSVRIHFETPLKKGEAYSFRVTTEEVETKALDDYVLFNKAIVFPKPVDSLTLTVSLPKGVFPELQSHGAACQEDCQCSQGGPCTCEECTTCITCRLGAWGTTTTQPPDDIIIESDQLTLIWKRSLRENERFDVDLLIPRKKSRIKWYIFGGFVVAGIFGSGFFIARRRRKSEVAQIFLNPDEKCIVDYIKEHGGEVLQQDIWRAQGVCYSRPKVSRIIADLEERGVIKREPYKKTFKVKLAK